MYINDAKHKANIEFTQDGIKAAAATFIGGYGAGEPFNYEFDVPVEEIDITFNKPYYLEVTATEAQILKDKGIPFCGKTPKPQSTINTSIIEIAFNDKAKVEKLLNTVRNKNNHTPKP